MFELENDIVKKKGKIIKQFTMPNGSLVSVYEYDGHNIILIKFECLDHLQIITK